MIPFSAKKKVVGNIIYFVIHTRFLNKNSYYNYYYYLDYNVIAAQQGFSIERRVLWKPLLISWNIEKVLLKINKEIKNKN